MFVAPSMLSLFCDCTHSPEGCPLTWTAGHSCEQQTLCPTQLLCVQTSPPAQVCTHTLLYIQSAYFVKEHVIRRHKEDQTLPLIEGLNHMNITPSTFSQGSSYLIQATLPKTSRVSGGLRDGVMTATVVECMAAKAVRSCPPQRPS